MKHNLKSDLDKLKYRGLPLEEDVILLKDKSLEELIYCLNDNDASVRTSAAVNLKHYTDKAADYLLLCLSEEDSLYTKIAICETLEAGNIDTARKMAEYLGKIGNNQYKKLPKKVSLKKSYPLPRDIIARTLAKMKADILHVLIEVLQSDDLIKIYEAADSFGYMCFYNETLQNEKNLKYIINLIDKYKDDKLLVWKSLTCLSAFNFFKSRDILNSFINEYSNEDILFLEAKRSLDILGKRQLYNKTK
ncbi:hypothetical protein [Brachyspira sp. G79]|uniref:HEAT repeat domain-containing protein n=1 Tax=Brachyspira sp. G79 TaxID=1358104 RepID=UPI000BBC444F|nr:hypothetical protein [Brachyspira sp. G79]PCG20806.1 hypothetical protein KQ44_13085 [Brachyspira sp. G79]